MLVGVPVVAVGNGDVAVVRVVGDVKVAEIVAGNAKVAAETVFVVV